MTGRPVFRRRPNAALSPRELDVLREVAGGRTNAMVGEALGLSPLTIKSHAGRIYRKLNATGREHAVAISFRRRDLAWVCLDDGRWVVVARKTRKTPTPRRDAA